MFNLRYPSFYSLYVFLLLAAVSVQTQIAAGQDSSTSLPRTQTAEPVPPPLSTHRAQFFRNNPAVRAEFLAQLPRHAAGRVQPTSHRFVSPASGTWQVAVNPFPPGGAANPLLLTDGTVIVAEGDSPYWYKLTPDINGSYVNGTWTQIASLPVIGGTQYAPLYHASAVLPDGRAIIMGGEYNGSGAEVWTNLGAIYDPVANTWTAVSAPSGTGWSGIGDAESTILADGTFMLAACCANPDVDALFDATSLTWTSTGAPNAGQSYQDEQGYELLPSGDVLTIDIWTNYPKGGATNAEIYSPSSGTWSSAGNTPFSLVDPAACGNWEIGPAVLRPDGTVVAFGGNTGCTAPTADPTAIYDSSANSWSSGPYVPAISGKSFDLADAPAALLPDGNILFAASPGYGGSPTHFFEFSTTNTIARVSDTLDYASSSGAYYYNFLVLPNGQIMSTDFSSLPEFYTPLGSPNSSWAPVISTVPSSLAAGSTYSISGTQFNGLSQGAYYGDDVQGATNYPLVRITNTSTSHVFYARTTNPSNSSVAPGNSVSANFTVPASIETGASSLVVVANGIASEAVSVTVGASAGTTVTLTPASLVLGSVAVNTTSTAKAVTLKNTGTATLDITSIVPSGSSSFAISANTCGATLAIGKTCKVSVTFSPTALGAQTGTLTFTDNATGSPQTVSISGTGVVQAKLTPASVKFPKTTVGTTSTPKTFTLTNDLNVALDSISISTSGAFAVSTTTCGSSLAKKTHCTISVVFQPTATGITSGTLSVSDSANNSPQTSSLTGTGD
jgi:Abnormal spindle-like microcephaly-assoc'd, ASPM-SPD-2-Hydin